MTRSIRVIFLGTMLSVLAAACATVQNPGQAGFLSDYSKLEAIDDNHLSYDSGKLGNYSTFIIEPVAMLYRQPEEERVFTDEELEDLKAHFKTAISEALTGDGGFQIVEAAGPGTARLRVAITDVDDTVGALNVAITTKITGAGLGGAAMEGELLDSVTGEQLRAASRWGSGSRVLRAGFTHTGDAKILMDRWAKDLRESLDAAHGR